MLFIVSIGFSFNSDAGTFAPVNGGVGMGQAPKDLPDDMAKAMGGMRGMNKRVGEYIIGLDMTKYLNYVANKTPLKTAPAFDALGVAGDAASGENDEFGDANNVPANFTDYSAAKNNTTVSAKVKEEEYLLNPMAQIGQQGVTVAPHWYIRHGAIDRDTAFPIPLNLATKLENEGKDVTIFATGHMVWEALKAAEALEAEGVCAEVVDIATIKPLDTKTVLASILKTGAAVVAEEHNMAGGLGELIAGVLAATAPKPLEYINGADQFGQSGTPAELLAAYGMDAAHIAEAAKKVMLRK